MKKEKCTRCGFLMDDDELNVEGYIHHHCSLQCKDRKACQRRKRKAKKKKK